jgi:aminotransferase
MSLRSQAIQLSVIKQMEILASKHVDVISLAQGIPSFDTPSPIKRRAERALEEKLVAKYSLSPGLPELREMVELSLAHEKIFYDWETEIIITAGSIEGITASLLAITDPGDEVIIPDPTYTSYREAVRLAGCTPVFVSLLEKEGWRLDIDLFAKAITSKTKAIFYCNPNNPTGTVYSKDDLIGLAKLAEAHNLFLIADEAYKDFIYDNQTYFSLAQLPQYRNRLIRVFSFSKPYAMTGWRVGYICAEASVAREILKVHDSLVTCAPVISQYAAMGALEMGEEWVTYFRSEYEKRRALMCSYLDNLPHIVYVKPTSAYFVFPKFHNCTDSFALATNILNTVKLATVPGIAFGPTGEGHLRLSFGRTEQDIEEGMRRLVRYVEKKL